MIWKFQMKLIIYWEESHSEISNNLIQTSLGGICVFSMGVFFSITEESSRIHWYVAFLSLYLFNDSKKPPMQLCFA